jgi:hypothetical protein
MSQSILSVRGTSTRHQDEDVVRRLVLADEHGSPRANRPRIRSHAGSAARYDDLVDRDRRAELIDRYRAGAGEVDAALEGVNDAELDGVPPDGGWTARMVIHHLADSESNSYVRVRTLLAEDEPRIQGYDEGRFAERLHYDRPVETSLAVFRAVRASTAELLDRLGDEDWNRAGTHSESGAYSMDHWLEIYAPHASEHADQIRRARGAA